MPYPASRSRSKLGFPALAILMLAFCPSKGLAVTPELEKAHADKAAVVRIERQQAERMANARPTRLMSPHYSVEGSDETMLYLLNSFNSPIEVDIEVSNEKAEVLLLGQHLLEPNQHVALSLRQQLAGSPSTHQSGSLWIDFLGDSTMVQGWVVLERGKQVVEVPLKAVGIDHSRQRTSFWDTRLLGEGVVPGFYLVNGAELPVGYRLQLGQGDKTLYRKAGTLNPGVRKTVFPVDIDPRLGYGWMRLSFNNRSDAVAIAGFLQPRDLQLAPNRSRHLSRLKVGLEGVRTSFTQFESLPFPLAASPQGAAPRTILSLFNSDHGAIGAEVILMNHETGEEVMRQEVSLGSKEIVSVELDVLAASLGLELPAEGRARVVADNAALQLTSTTELNSGEVLDVTFFDTSTAHQSGLYPLPNLDDFDVSTDLVNIGDETTSILGQISWPGGTYALEPIDIPAGESRRIDFADLAGDGKPDLLGRKLDPTFRSGFFQWSARGSHEVIARTQARPRHSLDRFGFNCHGCCPEESYGEILPGPVIVHFDTPTSFEGVEFISTCTGILGPYSMSGFSSLSYSSPVTWDGHMVSSSNLTDQNLRFTAWGDIVFDDGWECTRGSALFEGDNRAQADKCQRTHNPPPFDPTRGCADQSNSCSSCFSCCTKQKSVADCRCDRLPFGRAVCKNLAKAACGTCKQSCAGSLGCGGNLNC